MEAVVLRMSSANVTCSPKPMHQTSEPLSGGPALGIPPGEEVPGVLGTAVSVFLVVCRLTLTLMVFNEVLAGQIGLGLLLGQGKGGMWSF